MLYELATLSCPLLSLNQAAEGVDEWVKDGEAKGDLLGCWRTEIGTLGRLLVLRGFEQPDDMTVERRRALLSANPFNAGSVVTALEMDSYAPLPFLPPIRTGDRGGVYEFRTYRLKPGGLPATLAGWEAAIEPAKEYTNHLVTNMYALDGPPRITHIWGSRAWSSGARYAPGPTPPAYGRPRAVLSRLPRRPPPSLSRRADRCWPDAEAGGPLTTRPGASWSVTGATALPRTTRLPAPKALRFLLACVYADGSAYRWLARGDLPQRPRSGPCARAWAGWVVVVNLIGMHVREIIRADEWTANEVLRQLASHQDALLAEWERFHG